MWLVSQPSRYVDVYLVRINVLKGYGCWLSGIDVETELLYQSHQDPFVAIVIDPHKTAAAGRVEIGAFRAYPRGYTPTDTDASSMSNLPLDKVRDFGMHAKRYYSLDVEYYSSPLDQMVIDDVWKSYWADVLSTNNFEEAQRRFAIEVNTATKKCIKDEIQGFPVYAEKIHKCSCLFLSEVVTAALNRRMFSPCENGMDTSS